MRILIAPNAMKGSLSPNDFAEAIADGLLAANPDFTLIKKPLADGGDGTVEVLVTALGGEFVSAQAHDPLGRLIKATYGWLPQFKTAVIEMAEVSGIKLLQLSELNPMIASTYGTGELILDAVRLGAKKIILGIGGSATVDGGIGMMKALGFELLDVFGAEIANGGNGLSQLAVIKIDNVPTEVLNCEIVIASDVTNPLLGDNGAATVYGPQKGATSQMVMELESGMANYVAVLEKFSHKKLKELVGGGAAGGISIPLITFLNAKTTSGSDIIFDLLEIHNNLKHCDLVITGEGCIDSQTCQGKGPAAIAQAAKELGIPVLAIGGTVKPEASLLFDGIFSITNGPTTLENAMENAFELTKSLSTEIGKLINVLLK